MSRRTVWIVVAVVGVAVVAGAGYWWTQRQAQAKRPRGDPAVATAQALVALQRAPGLDAVRLTTQQIDTIIPLLRVLRDSDPNDREAVAAVVRDIRAVLTAEQIRALEGLRDRALQRVAGTRQARRRPPGGGENPGLTVAELRRRVIDRAIRVLEGTRRG